MRCFYVWLVRCCGGFEDPERTSILPPMEECPICLEVTPIVTLDRCGHKFCQQCINEWHSIHREKAMCPLCREKIGSKKRALFSLKRYHSIDVVHA